MKWPVLAYSAQALACFIFLFGSAAFSEAAVSSRALENSVTEAVNTEASAQRRIEAWTAERDGLLEEARTLKYELQWLELQKRKLERYIAANSAKIANMEEAQGRYAVIALELENSLLAELGRMEESIRQSPPFLAEERANRVKFLQESLNDPELSVGEKYRRFTEGLNAEVEYGRKLVIGNGVGRLDGEEMDLILIRAGRVAYYCLSMDRTRGGIWDKLQEGFTPLQGDELKAIQNIEMMSQTRQLYDFATLPAVQGVR
jgi:hypothetical protein